jgi:nucleotide-binding universal stress UspA family protein
MTGPIILVGVDGSPESLAAADWAGREAVRRSAGLRLLDVWQPPVGNVRFSPEPEGLRIWEETRVREAARELAASYPALAVEAGQIVGSPAVELAAAGAHARMLVIGSRALGAVSGFFHGSVGLHVAAYCERPVVAVRAEHPADPPRGTASPFGRHDGAHVVLALDLGAPCDALVAFAFEEAAAAGLPLQALHVWDERRLYGYAAPQLDPRLADDLRAEAGHELSRALGPWREKFPEVEVAETIAEGRAAERVVEAGRHAALLAVGRRRRPAPSLSRLGPVAHTALHHAPCPVAVVPHDGEPG